VAFSARSIAQQVTRATTPPASGASYRIQSGLAGRIMRQVTMQQGVVGTAARPEVSNAFTDRTRERIAAMERSTDPARSGSAAQRRSELPSIALGAARPEPSQVNGHVQRALAEGQAAIKRQAPRHAQLLAGTKPSRTPAQRAQVEAKKRIAGIRRPNRDSRGRKIALVGGAHPVDVANGLRTPMRGLTVINGRRLPWGTPQAVREATPEVAAAPPSAPGRTATTLADVLNDTGGAMPALETKPIDLAGFESIKFADAGPSDAPDPIKRPDTGGTQRLLVMGGVLVAAWLLFRGNA